MNQIDELITDLFKSWTGPASESLEEAKNNLHKHLSDQINGYWSGDTAYWIMTYGGFLMDAPSGKKKKLTAIGEMFMKSMEVKK